MVDDLRSDAIFSNDFDKEFVLLKKHASSHDSDARFDSFDDFVACHLGFNLLVECGEKEVHGIVECDMVRFNDGAVFVDDVEAWLSICVDSGV